MRKVFAGAQKRLIAPGIHRPRTPPPVQQSVSGFPENRIRGTRFMPLTSSQLISQSLSTVYSSPKGAEQLHLDYRPFSGRSKTSAYSFLPKLLPQSLFPSLSRLLRDETSRPRRGYIENSHPTPLLGIGIDLTRWSRAESRQCPNWHAQTLSWPRKEFVTERTCIILYFRLL